MDVPATVQTALDGESVVSAIGLNGENALYVTPSRTLYFRADGLLSDESVESYPHDAERLSISEGRRKATLTLDYGTDGKRSFSVPSGHVDRVVHPVLAGILAANGVTEPGETITRTERFSELTLVVTTERLVKHVGSATWDTDYEEVAYDGVRGLDVEDGTVATQLVIETPQRVQRVKVPADAARGVHESLESALFDYYGVSSYQEFERVAAAADDTESNEPEDSAISAFESPGIDPIDTGGADESVPADPGPTDPDGESEQTDGADATAAETKETLDRGAAGGATAAQSDAANPDPEELAERIEELEELLARQEDLLAKQRAVLGELANEVAATRDQ